jgi:hypothetical protein
MQWMGLSRARRRGGPAAAALHGPCVARAHATSPGARARRAARGRRVHTRNERGLHMPAAARPGRKLILRLQCPSRSTRSSDDAAGHRAGRPPNCAATRNVSARWPCLRACAGAAPSAQYSVVYSMSMPARDPS